MSPSVGGEDRLELVAFRVQSRDYAIAVSNAVEILRMVAITPVPEAPAWLAGVIDLRGRVIPVVDLRTRLGLPRLPPTLSTPIVVAEAGGKTLGLIADQAEQVLAVDREDVGPADELAGPAGLVSSVARTGGRLIMILDVERLLAATDAVALAT